MRQSTRSKRSKLRATRITGHSVGQVEDRTDQNQGAIDHAEDLEMRLKSRGDEAIMRLPLAEINTPPPQSQGQSEADFEPSHTAREKGVFQLFGQAFQEIGSEIGSAVDSAVGKLNTLSGKIGQDIDATVEKILPFSSLEEVLTPNTSRRENLAQKNQCECQVSPKSDKKAIRSGLQKRELSFSDSPWGEWDWQEADPKMSEPPREDVKDLAKLQESILTLREELETERTQTKRLKSKCASLLKQKKKFEVEEKLQGKERSPLKELTSNQGIIESRINPNSCSPQGQPQSLLENIYLHLEEEFARMLVKWQETHTRNSELLRENLKLKEILELYACQYDDLCKKVEDLEVNNQEGDATCLDRIGAFYPEQDPERFTESNSLAMQYSCEAALTDMSPEKVSLQIKSQESLLGTSDC